MVRTHGHLNSEETNQAAWIATRGAVSGAARWGLYSGLLGAAAWIASPVYRGLTIQFKVFLQMSGMALGSMIEADRRLRDHEVVVRQQKRVARDAAIWRRYEATYAESQPTGPGPDTPLPGASTTTTATPAGRPRSGSGGESGVSEDGKRKS